MFAGNLGNLRVVGPLVALKHLEIRHCRIQSIEVCDANLVSFSYAGQKINFLFRNVPLLVEVSVDYFCLTGPATMVSLSEIFYHLSQHLKVLKLNKPTVYGVKDHKFPQLVNLKHLELIIAVGDDRCILQLASFIRASPCLQNWSWSWKVVSR